MNYQLHYNNLIETRKLRVREAVTYYENHHIVLKSMGGSDDDSNLVYLTAREHFIAHWLLWRIYRNRQTAYAFYSFINFFTGHNHLNRPIIKSSRGFAEAKEAYSLIHKEKMKGVLNSNRSKPVIQMDLSGNIIKEWPSGKEAYRELGISHITSCCRGERSWAGGFTWKYVNSELKKSKPYKKRISTKLRTTPLSEKNRANISSATSDRKWYNDGKKDFFLKPFDSIEGLVKGRISIRKK